MIDLAIRGGDVIDGTGKPRRRSDVGVVRDKIVVIGEVPAARRTIDATGLIVAPGFIDLLGHSIKAVSVDPTAATKLRQGVTTEVVGEGYTASPQLSELATRLHDAAAINFAFLAGATSARIDILGSANLIAGSSELAAMKAQVEQHMIDGAIGLSTALAYVPGEFASTEEVVELARIAAQYGGAYFSHVRNESDRVGEAIEEAIEIGRRTGMPINVWHLKALGVRNAGRMPELLRAIEHARRDGVDIAANMYPYAASATALASRLPSWVLEGSWQETVARLSGDRRDEIRAHVEQALATVGGAEKVLLLRVPDSPMEIYDNHRLDQIARAMAVSESEAALRLIESAPRSPSALFFAMSESDVEAALSHPLVSFCSDAAVVPLAHRGRATHPRATGAFPRVLGHYVRDRKALTLEEAIRKMTSFAAERARLADRGRLEAGCAADVVVFDAEKIDDRATYERPHESPVGVAAVIVNGMSVFENGIPTGALGGRALRRSV